MKPYYQDDAVTIYHGNSLEIIQSLDFFDLVLADPPYGIDGGRGGTSKKRGRGNYVSDFEDTPEYIKTVCVPIIQLCLEKVNLIRKRSIHSQFRKFACTSIRRDPAMGMV